MTARKGGIGRRPGKKGKCCQKHITKTSATFAGIAVARKYEADKLKLDKSTVTLCSTPPRIEHDAHVVSEEKRTNEIIKIHKKSIASLQRSLKGANHCIDVVLTKMIREAALQCANF